jgi:hypothetical protein
MLGRTYKYSLFPDDLRKSRNEFVNETGELGKVNYVISHFEKEKPYSSTLVCDLARGLAVNSLPATEIAVSATETACLTDLQASFYQRQKALKYLTPQLHSADQAKWVYKHYGQTLSSLLRNSINYYLFETAGVASISIIKNPDEIELSYESNLFYCEKSKKTYLRVKDLGWNFYDAQKNVSYYSVVQSTVLYEVKEDGFHLLNISTDSLLVHDALMGKVAAAENKVVTIEDVKQEKYALIREEKKDQLPQAAINMLSKNSIGDSSAYQDMIFARYPHLLNHSRLSLPLSVRPLKSYVQASKNELNDELPQQKVVLNTEHAALKNKSLEVTSVLDTYTKLDTGSLDQYLKKRNEKYSFKDCLSSGDKSKRTLYLKALSDSLKKYAELSANTDVKARQTCYQDLLQSIKMGVQDFKPHKKYFFCGEASADSLRVLLTNLEKDLISAEQKLQPISTEISITTFKLTQMENKLQSPQMRRQAW